MDLLVNLACLIDLTQEPESVSSLGMFNSKLISGAIASLEISIKACSILQQPKSASFAFFILHFAAPQVLCCSSPSGLTRRQSSAASPGRPCHPSHPCSLSHQLQHESGEPRHTQPLDSVLARFFGYRGITYSRS